MVSDWLEKRGFQTIVEERRFGDWMRRSPEEPRVALYALARTALEEAGFDLVVEAGLGAGPEAFRSLAMHTFPATRAAKEIWSRQISDRVISPENMPAYQELKRAGMDSCGLAQLASRTVEVPFVGLIACCLAVSELLRRLHGGVALECAAGSVLALDDIESGSIEAEIYAFGYRDPCFERGPLKAVLRHLGWRLDADFAFDDGFRVVQFTPPGSGASVIFGTNVTAAPPAPPGDYICGRRRH